MASWVGAPAKTDPAIVGKLNAAVEAAIKNEAVQNKLKTIGFDPIEGSAAEADPISGPKSQSGATW